MRFRVTWREPSPLSAGQYYVSEPNYQGGAVVTMDEVEKIEEKLRDTERKLAVVQQARLAELASHDETVHQCPPGEENLMPCCGKTPLEVSRTDRMAIEEVLVTCGGKK